MIDLTEHKYLSCRNLKLQADAVTKLDSYQLAVKAVADDYRTEYKLRLKVESRLAQAYYEALEKALDDAEAIED